MSLIENFFSKFFKSDIEKLIEELQNERFQVPQIIQKYWFQIEETKQIYDSQNEPIGVTFIVTKNGKKYEIKVIQQNDKIITNYSKI